MTDIEHTHAKRAKERIESLTAVLAEAATELSRAIKHLSERTQKAIEEFKGAVAEDAIASNVLLENRMEEVRKKMAGLADFMLGEQPKELKGDGRSVATPTEIEERKKAAEREANFNAEPKPSFLRAGAKRDHGNTIDTTN